MRREAEGSTPELFGSAHRPQFNAEKHKTIVSQEAIGKAKPSDKYIPNFNYSAWLSGLSKTINHILLYKTIPILIYFAVKKNLWLVYFTSQHEPNTWRVVRPWQPWTQGNNHGSPDGVMR